jgi:MarR family transcriptional regulator, negative regulator of the multidrug operon emrRAB
LDKFTFVDRPDNQRLQLMKKVYPELNSDIVRLFIDFQWTYRNMQKAYDYVLDKNGLSESRFIILMFLYQAPSQTLMPSVISEKLGATRATVSKLLKGMEVKGWISKSSSTTDKRSFSVQLTQDGNLVLEEFLPENFNIVNVLFNSLNSEEMQQLSYLLKKIKDNTQKYNQENGELKYANKKD